jgi:hypothetical protein
MTTGRINQVTTFRSAFAATTYSRVTEHSLSWCGVRRLFFVSRPIVAQRTPSPHGVQASSNPQMASPHFPFSHVSSEIPLFHVRTKVTQPFNEDYQRPATPKRHAQTWRIPKWLSCIRSDHQQAIHLLQHRSSTSQKRWLKASKAANNHQGQSPSSQASHIAGLIDST